MYTKRQQKYFLFTDQWISFSVVVCCIAAYTSMAIMIIAVP